VTVSRTCTLCRHAQRQAIESDLAAQLPYRDIAKRYGTSAAAVSRHRPHVVEAVKAAQAGVEVAHGEDLLAKMASLEADAKRIGADAEKAGDRRTALVAVNQLVKIVELLARLRGELNAAGVAVGVQVNEPQETRILVEYGDAGDGRGAHSHAVYPDRPYRTRVEVLEDAAGDARERLRQKIASIAAVQKLEAGGVDL
jgi:hypothetical protein